MGNFRAYQSGHYLLELDGKPAGELRKLEGGAIVADVVKEKVGADHSFRLKSGSPVRFEDIVLTCGAGLSRTFYDWVEQATSGKYARKDGAVLVFNGDNKEISRLEWSGGLISDIEFPVLDAASKEPFSLTVKVRPEKARRGAEQGSRSAVQATSNWLASSFLLTIDGLEEACKQVLRIEPIAITWKVVREQIGQMRDYEQIELSSLEPGHLVVTLPESQAQGFYDWFQKLLVKGPTQEKNGRLESGAFSLQFGQLGIAKVSSPSKQPGAAMIRKTLVEMYYGSIKFSASTVA